MPFGASAAGLRSRSCVVVAAVLTIVYMIVVPSYQRSLENHELEQPRAVAASVVLPSSRPTVRLASSSRDGSRPSVERACRRLLLASRRRPARAATPTRTSSGDSTESDNDPIALLARSGFSARAGHRDAGGPGVRRGRRTRRASVVLLASPAARRSSQTVGVVRKRRARRGRRLDRRSPSLARLRAARASSPGASAGSSRPPSGSRPGTSTSRSSTPAPDELGQLARDIRAHAPAALARSTAPAASSSPTPRTSCARRSSRSAASSSCSTSRSSTRATREEFLASMREQVARLTKLATDLLDLSRLDAGRLRSRREPVDLAELADEVAAEFARPRAARRHALERRRGEPVAAARRRRADAPDRPDPGRERARAHACRDTVRVSAALDGQPATLTVADDGPGIPREARQQVFERFYRLDGARASGSGLGLAIARELAEVMGGRIELDSQNGWTLFTLAFAPSAAATNLEHGSSEPDASERENARARQRRRRYSGRPCAPARSAALALIAAVVGGAAVLLLGVAVRLAAPGDDEDRRRARAGATAGDAAAPIVARSRSLGNGFQPAQIFARAPPGVVTIVSYFDAADLPTRARARARASSSPRRPRADERRTWSRRAGQGTGKTTTRAHRLRPVLRRRPGARADRRLRPLRRRRRAPGRPEAARARPRAARRLEPRRRRPARGRDRQPVREHRFALGRRRLGDPALDPVADLELRPRRRDPDRRADQPRQLRRPALRRPRAA